MEEQRAEQKQQENKVLAALSYPIWIVALIIVVTDLKKDSYLKYHGWQALFYGVAWLVIWVALGIIGAVFVIVPVLGPLFNNVLTPLAGLAWLVISLIFAYKAYQGERFVVPVVSDFSKTYSEGGEGSTEG